MIRPELLASAVVLVKILGATTCLRGRRHARRAVGGGEALGAEVRAAEAESTLSKAWMMSQGAAAVGFVLGADVIIPRVAAR